MTNAFLTIDARILNRILVNEIQQHLKSIIHHDQVGFILEVEDWFKLIKQLV